MVIQINNTASLPVSATQGLTTTDGVAKDTKDASAKEAVAKERVLNTATESKEVIPATQTQVDKQELEASVSNINDYMQNLQRSIQFSIAESTGRTIIEVYDTETDKLIRSIPSEEVQRLSEAIADQLSDGLLIRENI